MTLSATANLPEALAGAPGSRASATRGHPSPRPTRRGSAQIVYDGVQLSSRGKMSKLRRAPTMSTFCGSSNCGVLAIRNSCRPLYCEMQNHVPQSWRSSASSAAVVNAFPK